MNKIDIEHQINVCYFNAFIGVCAWDFNKKYISPLFYIDFHKKHIWNNQMLFVYTFIHIFWAIFFLFSRW